MESLSKFLITVVVIYSVGILTLLSYLEKRTYKADYRVLQTNEKIYVIDNETNVIVLTHKIK